ncbi:Dickkopf-related protein 4 [Camelus dromedarius]|uniref:Dickkopf-related protein 4 n=1 Tax=Camelus dromedarius TaxID=9838 RepID=A0A5N4CFR4_CAMDR|nr:Dickkopf-related protein 4 [Camelus dromedarius]
MVAVVLLGLGWLCAPLGALVLDFNNIKSSADAQGARKGSQCLSDKDCSTRKFCLRPQDEKPFCATCRGLRRRCQRDAMCCPGSLCVNGQEGGSCLRTSDCGPGLCCARHFWTKICKPVLLEGQVCSRRGHKEPAQAPEIFQRCDCGPGLSCRSPGAGTRQSARLRVCQKI